MTVEGAQFIKLAVLLICLILCAMCSVTQLGLLWTVVHQFPLCLEFSRQGYWNGLLFPTPEDFPDPGIESMSLVSLALAGKFFITTPPGKPIVFLFVNLKYPII